MTQDEKVFTTFYHPGPGTLTLVPDLEAFVVPVYPYTTILGTLRQFPRGSSTGSFKDFKSILFSLTFYDRALKSLRDLSSKTCPTRSVVVLSQRRQRYHYRM